MSEVAETRRSFEALRVIDVDTHLTEPADLWTARAPRGFEERVPHMVDFDDGPHWVVDGVDMGFASASSVVKRDGSKQPGTEFIGWGRDLVHVSSYDMAARLEMMDSLGIYAQILYPNFAGFGSQRFAAVEDPELKLLCVTLYNDAMAEIQENSGGRLFPMALMPWWDVEATLAEVERSHGLGLRGVVQCNAPHSRGAPDLGEAAWDPFWSRCSDLGLPVNFHIGASEDSMEWYGNSPWPSQGDQQKLAIGSALIYVENARVLSNLIYSGVLERHPELKVVSVESGIGWIPFVLEALDHQLRETAPSTRDTLSMMPSEYFRRQVYGCFWFERLAPAKLIDDVGAGNVLFETDFPHPTCLYPDSLDHVADVLQGVDPGVQRQVLQDNAAPPASATQGEW